MFSGDQLYNLSSGTVWPPLAPDLILGTNEFMNERTTCKLLIKPPRKVLKVVNKTKRFARRIGFKNDRLWGWRTLRQRPIWRIAHILPEDTLW